MNELLLSSNILVLIGFVWIAYLTIRYRTPGSRPSLSPKAWKQAGFWGHKNYRSDKQGLVVAAWTTTSLGMVASGVIRYLQ